MRQALRAEVRRSPASRELRRLRHRARLLSVTLSATLSATACLSDPPPAKETTPRATPAASAPEPGSPPIDGEEPPRRQDPERATAGRSAWLDPYERRSPAPLILDVAIHDAAAAELDRLQSALAGVHDRPTSLRPRERLILHNDLWGLIVRLDQGTRSTAAASRLRETAAALLRRLAPPGESVDPELMPAELGTILPPREGWRELASELPALQHELSFGDRRLFRLFRRPLDDGEELALADHLLVIDDGGRVRRTAIIGEVELLRFRGGELVAAEVYELSRAGQDPRGLRPVAEIAQIPGPGADSPIAEFDPPEPLSDLPCLRCHHDDSRMSLPSPSADPRWREAGVLRRAQESADRVWAGAPLPL